jgi:hypothetical protein
MLQVSVPPREHHLAGYLNIGALLFWIESMYDPLNISWCHPLTRHIPHPQSAQGPQTSARHHILGGSTIRERA